MAVPREERELLRSFYEKHESLLLAVMESYRPHAEPEVQNKITEFQSQQTGGTRQASDRPALIEWTDGNPSLKVSTSKEVLVAGANKAVDLGLDPSSFPVRAAETDENFGDPREIKTGHFIESKLNQKTILKQADSILSKAGAPKGLMIVTTASGVVYRLP